MPTRLTRMSVSVSSADPASSDDPPIPADLKAALERFGLFPERQLGEGGCGVVFRTLSLPDTSHQTITPGLAHWFGFPQLELV